MLALLSIISLLFIISNANTCPDGTAMVGEQGTYLMTYNIAVYIGQTIDICNTACDNNAACTAFTFDSDYNGFGTSLCFLNPYSKGTTQTGTMPDLHTRGDQVVCALDACPDGSTQIGDAGAALHSYESYGRVGFSQGINTGLTADICESRCESNSACLAFVYDADYQYEGGSIAGCSLYRFDQQVGDFDYGDISEQHPRADSILCSLDLRSSAQSPGLFNLDGVDGNINGESYVYIMYGIIALVLANIICLAIYCCSKGRNNKRKYKVVSMRSDTETDIECQ